MSLSVCGVGLALLLILSLDSIYSALLKQVTAYTDNVAAPVIVSQRGVETMHMSSSALPAGTVKKLRDNKRISKAEPILYMTTVLGSRQQAYSYLIGFKGSGGPWQIAKGDGSPHGNQIVIDKDTATKLDVGIGSHLKIAGEKLRVVGLARGTASVVSAVAFVDYATFARLLDIKNSVSYILVWPAKGISTGSLVSDLNRSYPKLTAQTKGKFSDRERQVVSDMSTGLIRGLVLIGSIVGLIVAGLSIYTATTAQLREYAVLKAIGMRNIKLYGLISQQAVWMLALGLALAVLLVYAMSVVIPQISPSVSMIITPEAFLRTAAITTVIGVLAALLPAWRVANVDPASVYRI